MENIQIGPYSDADMDRAIKRAHELRSEAFHNGLRTTGQWLKSQFRKLGFYLSRREAA